MNIKKIIIPFILIWLVFLTGCDEKEFVVNFIGYNNEIIDTFIVNEEEEIKYPSVPVIEGYDFIGWDKEIKYTDSNVIIKAQYQIKTYTVVFYDTNDNLLSHQKVEYGKNAVEPEVPDITGYKFVGWSKDINNIKKDLDVIPVYESKTYVVKFYDINREVLEEKKVKHGESVEAPEAPKVEGYRFLYWKDFLDNITSDLEVSAIYSAEEYIIKFYDGMGKVISKEKVSYGKSANEPNIPQLEGHTFVGWDKDFKNIKSNLNIYPFFERNEYTVEFYDAFDILISTQKVKYGDSAIAPKEPQKKGYIFQKWNIDYTIVHGDLKIYPIFKGQKCYVTFYESIGKPYDIIDIEYGKTAYQPNDPDKYNYIFMGWYEDSWLSIKYDFSKEVTENIDLYAKFEINAVKVTNAITTNYIKGIVKIYNKSYNTILGIPTTSSTSLGSGFCFHIQNGCYYILTNCHVAVKNPEYNNQEFIIEDYKGNTYKGYLYKNPNKTVSAIASSYDLACLYFKPSYTEVIKLELADVNPNVLEDVISIGSPEGQTNSIAYGSVQNYKKITLSNTPTYLSNVQFDVICHNGYLNNGSSGGPILNANFEVIGVNYAGTKPVYYGYAVPIEKVKEFLKLYVYN